MKKVRKQLGYPIKKLKWAFKRLLGWSKTPVLQAYRGYITESGVFVRGRLLEDNGLAAPKPTDRWYRNALSMLKRYLSTGLPDVIVSVHCLDYTIDILTDVDGYFEVAIPLELTLEKPISFWASYKVEINPSEALAEETKAEIGELMNLNIPPAFGVISDIDDTLLVSHSTDFIRKLVLMLRKNAYSRLPFDGAAPFYRALQEGVTGKQKNPFFYISSSEWGLYDLLADFCKVRNIPKGVFLLRTLPNSFRRYLKYQMGNHNHKYYKIKEVLNAFPNFNFILIGDSGQHDPEIYQKIVEEYPHRICSIYIRNVSSSKRKKEVEHIAVELSKAQVPMALVEHTKQAAKHAMEHGFINADYLHHIHNDKPKKLKSERRALH